MKKTYKDFYKQSKKIRYIDVTKMTYLTVDGVGDPNTNTEFKQAIELLYKFSYFIRMSYKKNIDIENFKIYNVGPLEGIYTTDDNKEYDPNHKENLKYKLMINQPDFVTKEVFNLVKEYLVGTPFIERVNYQQITEKECVQIMHIGSYDEEPATLKPVFIDLELKGYDYIKSSHHEIYTSDHRKVCTEKLKTLIRYQIMKK
jgi:hypothetical protein